MTNEAAVGILRASGVIVGDEPTDRRMIGVHAAVTRAVAECVKRDSATEREAFGRHVREMMAESPRVAAYYLDWLRRMADAATRGAAPSAAGAK